MNLRQAKNLIDRVSYKGWDFKLKKLGDGLTLQARFEAPDNVTGKPALQSGRKWLISKHATPSELILTALKAVLTAEEHEAREQFYYCGKTVFNPHIDVRTLYDIADSTDVRTP